MPDRKAADGLRSGLPPAAEPVWDGEDTNDDNAVRRNLSDLGPLGVTRVYRTATVGPVNANSTTIRDYLRVIRTRYISMWQLAALGGGMQVVLYFSSPYRRAMLEFDAPVTVVNMLFEQVHYWAPSLLALVGMAMVKRHRSLNFLDMLFDRIAVQEQEDRSAVDEEVQERILTEQRRAYLMQEDLKDKLRDAEAGLAIAEAINERAKAVEAERKASVETQLQMAREAMKAAQRDAQQQRELAAQHVQTLQQLTAQLSVMEQRVASGHAAEAELHERLQAMEAQARQATNGLAVADVATGAPLATGEDDTPAWLAQAESACASTTGAACACKASPAAATPTRTEKYKPKCGCGCGGANCPAEVENAATETVLKVLAAKTGYEPEMIEMDMNLETELGVDSIKRVEILSDVQKELNVEAQNVAALSRTQTVGEVVEAMIAELGAVGGGAAAAPLAASVPSTTSFGDRDVDLTAFPAFSPTGKPNEQSAVFTIRCPASSSTNGFLDAHVIQGKRVLPMTCAIGHIAASVVRAHPGYHLHAVEDMKLFGGVNVDADVEVSLTSTQQQGAASSVPAGLLAFSCKLLKKGPTGRFAPAYGARVVLTPTTPRPLATSAWPASTSTAAELTAAQLYDGRTLFHGAALQQLRSVVEINDAGLKARATHIALGSAAEGQFSGGHTVVDGFAADHMLQAMLVWCRHKYGVASLPSSMGRLEWYRPLPTNGEYYVSLQITSSNASSKEQHVAGGAVGNCFFHDASGVCFLAGHDLAVTLNETLEYRLGGPTATATPAAAAPKAAPKKAAPAEEDPRIAVIGMAVKYAGAPNVDEFWKMITANKRADGPVSAERLGIASKEGHLTDGTRQLGADAILNDNYGALSGDNQPASEHEMLLNLARTALKDAGSPDVGARCGIVSGCLSFPRDGMQRVLQDVYTQHTERELGTTAAMAAGAAKTGFTPPEKPPMTEAELRKHAEHTQLDPASFVAREVGLSEGAPRLCLDAACSSALYCMKIAQDYLLTHKTDLMLASASCFPEPMFVLSGFSAFQALPAKGSGKPSLPFERDTAGLTPGEGGAVIVLKRLADAERDGDRIYGTLLGAHVSNAGTGLPLKPDMPSELKCLSDTYAKFGIEPASMQYVECHATGTPQGDACEIKAIRGAFVDQGAPMPQIGSTKGHFGHTLVAAGFAGCAKLMLSFKHGTIPAGPKFELAMDRHVVTRNSPWPATATPGAPKRAGLSAFGFGGTNAHAVFEEYRGKTAPHAGLMKVATPQPLAIVGMAAHFGALSSLEQLEGALYAGTDGSCELPPKRWRFLQKDETFRNALLADDAEGSLRGCFVQEIEVDHMRLKLPMLPEDQLQAQQLLALTTIDKALIDSGVKFAKGAKVAVLVGLGTDMELYRHRARVALRERLGIRPHDTLTAEQSALLAYVSDLSTATSYTSNIGNIIATRIASLWGFVGPAFSVTQGANSVYRALELAQDMLASGEIDAAVVAGVDLGGSAEALFARRLHKMFAEPGEAERLGVAPAAPYEEAASPYVVGEGAGCLVLQRKADVCTAPGGTAPPDRKVYACVDALAEAATVEESARAAMATAGIGASDVGYVEMSADGSAAMDDDEIRGVAAAYQQPATAGAEAAPRSVAVGTAKSTVGHTGYASGAASLIKAALCLHHRYVPCTSRWRSPKPHMADAWDASALYVPGASRAWVANTPGRRYAAVSGVASTAPGSKFHVLLSDGARCYEEHNVLCLQPSQPKLLVVHGETAAAIAAKVDATLGRLRAAAADGAAAVAAATESEMAALLLETVNAEKAGVGAATPGRLALCIVASAAQLLKELERASKGVPAAAASGKDHLSPSGSFFAPRPRRSSKVAFMYGDGSAPYAGLGAELHRIVPSVHEFVQGATTSMWGAKHDTWNARGVRAADAAADAAGFESRTVDMFRSGVYHSVVFTYVARRVLRIVPTAAFGLSLGEAAMYFAFDEHNSRRSDELLAGLDASPVWTRQLSVRFDALRSAWGVPADAPVASFWSGLVVQAGRARVEAALASLGEATRHVRLVIVNDSKTCIVAGRPEQCAALVAHLGVGAMPIEQGMCGHCQEVQPFVDEIAHIHRVLRVPQGAAAAGVAFYSSGGDAVERLDAPSKRALSAAQLVANVYKGVADFAALVEAAHAGGAGADVFVELGPDQLRAAATKDVLGGKGAPHVAVAIDRRGGDAWRQLLKLAATLISHGETGCQVGALYHPRLLADAERRVNGPFVSPAKLKAVRKIAINGRFTGSVATGGAGATPLAPPAATGDARLLGTLKRVPTSVLDLSELGRASREGSANSLRSLGAGAGSKPPSLVNVADMCKTSAGSNASGESEQ